MNQYVAASHNWKPVLSGDGFGMLKTQCIRRRQQSGVADGAIKFFCDGDEFVTTIGRNNDRVTITDGGQDTNIKPVRSFGDFFSALGNQLTQITVT